VDASQALHTVTVATAATIEYVILSSVWMGRHVKQLGKLLIDNPITQMVPKILATLLVIAAHQLLPFTWQIGFWIGAGGFFIVTGASYRKPAVQPIIFGSAASWMLYAAQSADIALKATSCLTTIGAIGMVVMSITSSISWLAWGLEN